MRKIIGINGLIGAGKDTIADYLVENHNFVKLSFAKKLKDIVAFAFDLDRSMLEGSTPESRAEREKPIDFWSNEVGKNITPRYILQVFGTDCMRNGFYDDIWIAYVKKEITENPNTNFVIPDVRFPNEGKMIKEIGGQVWHVQRGDLPTWWDDAARWNLATKDGRKPRMANPLKNLHVHVSETSMAGYNFDKSILNNGSLQDLYEQIRRNMA